MASSQTTMLVNWNGLEPDDAVCAILPCCGSEVWARMLADSRPIAGLDGLLALSDRIWQALPRPDQQQAFDSHPRLGESHAKAATPASLSWSGKEQSHAEPTEVLREANVRYERRFGRIFLLCANGRTTAEILAALYGRIDNDAETEWREAVEQQRQITHIRLQRWLESGQ